MKFTLWIVIGRMQPVHIWHQRLIDSALREQWICLVLLWGNDEIDAHNPYTFEQRDEMLQRLYPDSNLMIDYIRDTPTDKQWVENMSTQILKLWIFDAITFYVGDREQDSAVSALQKHQEILDVPEIHFTEINRKKIKISHDNSDIAVSATAVRAALWDRDYSLVQKILPEEVYEYLLKK